MARSMHTGPPKIYSLVKKQASVSFSQPTKIRKSRTIK